MASQVCPICGRGHLRKIAPNRYYCADCCYEVAGKAKKAQVFFPDIDGELRKVGTLQDVRRQYLALQG